MNLQSLLYVVEVSKTSSISKAAENLLMNQPNLSKAIREIESSLGITIFKRSHKGVEPTEEGLVFLEYARGILMQYDKMKESLRPSNKQSMRIAVPRASYISETLTRFVEEQQGEETLDICFRETDSMTTLKNLTDDGYSFGVVRFKTQFEKYYSVQIEEHNFASRELLCTDPYVLLSAESGLANKSRLDIGDLEGLIEIANEDFAMPTAYHSVKTQTADAARRRISVYERGSQFDLLSRIPNTYMWVSPMPSDVLNRNSLVQRKCELDGTQFKDVLLFSREHVFSDREKRFLEILNCVIKEVLSDQHIN